MTTREREGEREKEREREREREREMDNHGKRERTEDYALQPRTKTTKSEGMRGRG